MTRRYVISEEGVRIWQLSVRRVVVRLQSHCFIQTNIVSLCILDLFPFYTTLPANDLSVTNETVSAVDVEVPKDAWRHMNEAPAIIASAF